MTDKTPEVHEALAVYVPETTEPERVPEGYKSSEVGVIPEDWEVRMFGEVFDFLATASNSRAELNESGTVLYVHYGDIHKRWNHLLDFAQESLPRIEFSKVKSAALLRDGDLILADASEDPEGVGKSVEVKNINGAKAVAGLHTFLLRDRRQFFAAGYTGYIQSNASVKESLDRIATGLKVYGVSKNALKSVMLPVPPLHEQRDIAAALSDVDDLISALDELIAKKRAVKTAAMQQLLTGKQRLPGFSGEWKVKRLGDVFTLLSTASNSRSDLTEHGEVGYIHYGDIHGTDSSFLDCDTAKIPHIASDLVKHVPLLEEGDLVMADASEDYEGIGKGIEVKNLRGRKLVAGLHTLLLRGNKAIVADRFKGYLQYVPAVRSALVRLATGISVYGISKNNVRSIEVSLPGIEEQTAIAAMLSDMDAEIEALEARREKTRQVKRGMMQELLTGRTRLV